MGSIYSPYEGHEGLRWPRNLTATQWSDDNAYGKAQTLEDRPPQQGSAAARGGICRA